MNKTVTVNIGGLAFIIDENAYARLNEYLGQIENEMKFSNDKHEVLKDIESRIAEILKENARSNKEIIDINDIEEIIRTMGNPSEFGEMYETNQHSYHEKTSYKRIYRDPDNRVIGGVCGGLGAYFSIDPLIVRVLFAALILIAGTGLLVYLIMWIIIPEARTVAQKLEMRGEPVNISNIGEKIKEEFNNVKRKMNL